MIKLCFYLISLSLVAALVSQGIDYDGLVTIDVQSYQIQGSLMLLVIGVVLVMLILVCVALWMARLVSLPGVFSSYVKAKQQAQDQQNIILALYALSCKQLVEARRSISKLSSLVNPELTMLLEVKLAEFEGNDQYQEELLTQMLGKGTSQVFALKSFLELKFKQRDFEAALKFAQQIKAELPWLLDYLVELYQIVGDYEKAVSMVKKKLSLGLLDKLEAERLISQLYFSLAKQQLSNMQIKQAIASAKQAKKRSLGDPEISAYYDELCASYGKKRYNFLGAIIPAFR